MEVGDEETLLVVHGDLPLLSAADISALLDKQRQFRGLIIGCDSRCTGSNLMAFERSATPQFMFGANSCARHVMAAVCRLQK